MRKIRPLLRLSLAWPLLAAPGLCHAQGAQGLADWLMSFLTTQFLMAVGGIIFLFVFYYGVRLILESQDEGAITTARKSFLFAIVGFGILAVMFPLARVFLNGTSTMPFVPSLGQKPIADLMYYAIIVSKGALVMLATFHALRMITSQGDETIVTNARKSLVNNIIGVVLLQIADTIVRSVMLSQPLIIATELAGLARFVFILIAVTSFLALIFAGVLLIVSVNDSLAERAKKTVTITIVAIILSLLSYLILLLVAGPAL